MASGSRVDSATPSGAWEALFLLVGFFQNWNGAERREGLVRLRVPARVSKLRERGSTQNLLGRGVFGSFN